MKYKWLFFDADGTLFNFDKSQDHAIKETIITLGLPFKDSYYQTYFTINKKIWQMLEKNQISQTKLPVTRFEMFFDEIDVQADAAEASKLYLQFLAQGTDLIKGANALINKLKNSHNLVLITNGLKAVQRTRFTKAPITKNFKEIIISEEVGHTKPHKEIFEITFDRIGKPDKKDVLIIGDNPGSDILGGINYGIDTCWYNPHKQAATDSIIPTYEISNLAELLNLV